MWVQSLGWEDPLEDGIATHSSVLAWRIPWTEEPGRLQSMGSQRVGHNLATFPFTFQVHLSEYKSLCERFLVICRKRSLFSFLVVSDSLQPYGLQPAGLLCPWDSPGKVTGLGSHALLQGIFPTQGSNPSLLCLLYWQADSLPLVPAGKPWWLKASHIYYLPFLEKFKLCFMALKSRCLVELGPSWCL